MQKDLSKVLLITDLDGTFLPDTKQVSRKDMEAVHAFRAAGGRFSVATGRSIQATEHFFSLLELDTPMIMYNGALIWDPVAEKPIHSFYLPNESKMIAKAVLDEFSEAACEVLRLDDIYVPRMNEVELYHISITKTNPVIMPLEQIDGQWLKVLFAIEPKKRHLLEDFCTSRPFGFVDFVASERHFYEMLPKNVSKGTALKTMLELCGFGDYTVFAAGDYDNDLEMLEAADYSFATANALPSVRAAVDVVLEADCNSNPMTEILNYINNIWNGGKKDGRGKKTRA